ncbi:putative helicase [Podosphaera aphanis]|nr:putative helicase [Podosphaera aphanis]
MAGGKKKKKPVSNPARGFATTSIASKPKVEIPELEELSTPLKQTSRIEDLKKDSATGSENVFKKEEILTAEEFGKQLEESELQVLVDKYAQKSKKDAQRQKTRMDTDRRILRGQADILQTRKWLPMELLQEILELVKTEGQVTGQGEIPTSAKQVSEEELSIRLWTLQQVLESSGFSEDKVLASLRHVLNISNRIGAGSKDAIWGLEDSLEWLCRECSKEELPDYENGYKNSGSSKESDVPETPNSSGIMSPSLEPDVRHLKFIEIDGKGTSKTRELSPIRKKSVIDYESDIDPDDLLPTYLDCQTKIFNLQASMHPKRRPYRSSANQAIAQEKNDVANIQLNELIKKIKKIEDDILFDKYIADQKWETMRIQLQKDAAVAHRKVKEPGIESSDSVLNSPTSDKPTNDVDIDAAKIADELLEENSNDEDIGISDFFASLPTDRIDPINGKSTTEINEGQNVTMTIRDFGKWSGVSPSRVLEEACRARDTFVKQSFTLVSASSFSNRHSLQIVWSKVQKITFDPPATISCKTTAKSHCFTMTTISTPDSRQSEAYIATAALFSLFSSSTKEDKVFLRLPPVWRDLWNEFMEEKKDLLDKKDRNSIRVFRDMVREKKDQELEDGVLIQSTFKKRNAARALDGKDPTLEKINGISLTPEALFRIWAEKSSTHSYQAMLHTRSKLPIWGFKDVLLDTINREQVVIICGETGCGKSTQVPSFILENQLYQGKACKIYVTEPRRISAISLARRVSEELGERKNELGTSRSLVGYAIRLESSTSKETRLVYATTGIIMRMLEASNDLKDITHIILDEIHERTIDSDFLLIVLRKLLVTRPDLKVVLMSATVDAERFSRYFDGAPVLHVPGRTFPVRVKFLEDAIELTDYSIDNGYQEKYTDIDDIDSLDPTHGETKSGDNGKALKGYSKKTRNTISQLDEYRIDFELITQLLAKIATDDQLVAFSKAILVFLPGIGEIRQLNDMLFGHPVFSSNWHIYLLHSTIASEDQEAAFLMPPMGIRKIVLATNIAETGITIPDVTCVIDTGKHREMRFDERRQLSRLLETFISKANAKQRRGRAGRVQEGLCFHMFSKYRHDNLMADQQTPELLRLSLQDLAIRVKICKLGGIEETLGQALDPPLQKNIRRAIDSLVDVRALTPGEDLTALGKQLARLPLDVFLGKLILLGCIFKCLDASLTIAAILSSKSPFIAPFGVRTQADAARLAFRRGDSDLLTVYNAYIAWKKVCITGASEYQFCKKNFLSQQVLANIEDLKGQLIVCLVDSGFLPLTESERLCLNRIRYSNRRRQFFDLPQRSNVNSDNDKITSSVISWAFYPKLLTRDGKGYRNCANNQTIRLYPSSVNKGNDELKWLSYYHIMQAKQFYNAHETTAAEDFAIALLCGEARCDIYSGVIVLDGNRARFAVSDWKTMLAIRTLRARLREILVKSFKNPGKQLNSLQQKWMDIWQKIFSQVAVVED